MYNGLPWTLLLVLQFLFVISHPVQNQLNTNVDIGQDRLHKEENSGNLTSDEQIISVRVTSSVAVGRQNGKLHKISYNEHENKTKEHSIKTYNKETPRNAIESYGNTTKGSSNSDLPPDLFGANIEFIKQLYAKKELKDSHTEQLHPFQIHIQNQNQNKHNDFDQSATNVNQLEDLKNIDEVPIGRKIPITNINNKITDTNNATLPNLYHATQFPENADNSNLNKSEEILVHSSTKFVLNVASHIVGNGELHKNRLMAAFENETNINMSNNNVPLRNNSNSNNSDDTIAESSIKSYTLESGDDDNDNYENVDDVGNVPLARSISFPRAPYNYLNNVRQTTKLGKESNSQLTTVSFSIIHDTPINVEETNNQYVSPDQPFVDVPKVDAHPKVYSEPAKIYSEPAKFYSEPSKIYSEPAKIYSEPAKVYSEPAKIYSEPAKFYSEPASLHLPNQPQLHTPSSTITTTTAVNTPSVITITQPSQSTELQPDKNYEVDEKVTIQSDGRSYDVQDSSTEKCQQDNCKVGYVVEGRQYKKYRVEERTSDGFIVGEYGVVRNNDGALRGVRYTADSAASPRLIHDALMKFLQLR